MEVDRLGQQLGQQQGQQQGGEPAAAAAEPPRAVPCGIDAFPSLQQALAAPGPVQQQEQQQEQPVRIKLCSRDPRLQKPVNGNMWQPSQQPSQQPGQSWQSLLPPPPLPPLSQVAMARQVRPLLEPFGVCGADAVDFVELCIIDEDDGEKVAYLYEALTDAAHSNDGKAVRALVTRRLATKRRLL